MYHYSWNTYIHWYQSTVRTSVTQLRQEFHVETVVPFTFITGQRKGALLELVGVCVNPGSRVQQDLGYVDMSSASGLHQWSVPVLVVLLHIGARFDQIADYVFVATTRRIVERGVA